MSSKCAASLMLEIVEGWFSILINKKRLDSVVYISIDNELIVVGKIVPEARKYMLQVLNHQRFHFS